MRPFISTNQHYKRSASVGVARDGRPDGCGRGGLHIGRNERRTGGRGGERFKAGKRTVGRVQASRRAACAGIDRQGRTCACRRCDNGRGRWGGKPKWRITGRDANSRPGPAYQRDQQQGEGAQSAEQGKRRPPIASCAAPRDMKARRVRQLPDDVPRRFYSRRGNGGHGQNAVDIGQGTRRVCRDNRQIAFRNLGLRGEI